MAPRQMKTISLRVAASVDQELTRRAAERGLGKSDLVREAVAEYLLQEGPELGSFLEAAADLIGSVDAPPGLASHPRHLAGYGSRRRAR